MEDLHQASIPSQQSQPPLKAVTHNNDSDGFHPDQRLHNSSISPIGRNDSDHWIPGSKPWESHAAYTPSPEQQHAVLSHDGQSISTTDISSTTAGKSTPESQQTSNTSYRESENHRDENKQAQQGDDSFYWNSGPSSSEADGDHSQLGSPTATPGESIVESRSSATTSTIVPLEHEALPTRSTSLSPVLPVPYGASALGFGGPSDWEYFGDYEAEEIDDEELYSRPRAQDGATVKDASAELPGDTISAEVRQQSQESESQRSGLECRKTPPLRDASRAEQLRGSASQEEVAQNTPLPDPSDHSKAHGRDQSHAVGGDVEMAPDMSSDQRPDLDEVIRAWSEAPYVGKLEDNGEGIGVDTEPEPPGVAEASLASTPQERMLGIDVILRDAPSLPKLPASLEQVNSPEEGNRPSSDFVIVDAATSMTHKVNEEQIPVSPKRPTGRNDLLKGPDALMGGEDEGLDKVRLDDNKVPDVNQRLPGHGMILTDTHQTGLTVSDTESNARDGTLISDKKEPTFERTDMIVQKASQMPLPEATEDSAATTSQNVPDRALGEDVPANVYSSVQIADKPSLQEILPEPQRQLVIEESSAKASLEPLRTDSEAISQSIQPKSTRETTRDSQEITRKALPKASTAMPSLVAKEGSQSESPILSCQQHPHGALKPSDALEAVDHPTPSLGTGNEPTQEQAVTQPVLPAAAAQEPPPKTVQGGDPYADLDPWGKASLNRFAAMLREEARAESNKDKLNIFNVFTSRESRLRVVLYGSDEELLMPLKTAEQKPEAKPKPEKVGYVKQAVQRANTMNLQRSLKALPALPSNRDSVMGVPGDVLAPLVIQEAPNLKPMGEMSQASREDTPEDGAQYSPGGRPIISSRLSRIDKESGAESMQHTRSSSMQSTLYSSEVAGALNAVHSPSSDAPIALEAGGAGESKQPTFTPVKHNEGRAEVKNYLTNRKSICRPYATLTQGTFESGSNFGRERDLNLPGHLNAPITAPTSQYNPNLEVRGDDASDKTIKPKPSGVEPQTDLRRFVKADFDPLLLVLPESEATVPEPARLADLKNIIEAVPDDFSFIHGSVVAWDAKAKKQREENDRQRHARQVESEQRIDSLFDDHEIGYGDISELEAEFKQSEAARRADEDRSEYQTFVVDVFNVVWTRLHFELDQLIPHYEQYSMLMNDTLAGKDMFEGSKDGLPLAPTMSAFLALHQKLEIRHQKAFEAVLERDRRLKKTEISPWYTLSNIAKVKQLEKQFEDAEKKAVIEYCQQRDTRANRLMDVLDQNTLRGVGANQDYMEAIMKAVRRIASGRAFASVPGSNEPTAGLEEVKKAKDVTTFLATSSEQIVQTFHVADMLLNSADYEVSVAKAKVAKADQTTLAKLKEERMKEDQKLMRDLEHRLALIREDSRRTNDEIVKLMLFLGVQNGRADNSPVQAGPADAGHETRIQKALEEAKKRNALKESGG